MAVYTRTYATTIAARAEKDEEEEERNACVRAHACVQRRNGEKLIARGYLRALRTKKSSRVSGEERERSAQSPSFIHTYNIRIESPHCVKF